MMEKLKSVLAHWGRVLFRRGQLEDDLAEEIQLHIEELAEEYEAKGMSKKEAMRAARLRFGGTEVIREECRDSWAIRFFSSYWRDFRLGMRRLLKDLGYSTMSFLSLSFGIGAAITIFAFLNVYLLKGLPYPDSKELTYIRPTNEAFGPMSVSYTNFKDWQRRADSFSELECTRFFGYNLTGVETPESLAACQASGGFLKMMGAGTTLGHLFGPEESHRQASPTVILSHQFWERFYSRDRNIIGKSMILDGESYTIIGVLNEAFQFPPMEINSIQIWTPIELMERDAQFIKRFAHNDSHAVGRLKKGVSLEMAQAEMTEISVQLKNEYPDTNIDDDALVEDLQEALSRDRKPGLLMLMGAVGCLLLIVCVNLAGLLTARLASRVEEFSFRTALGAKRWDIVRQLLCENTILTVFGAMGGLMMAGFGVRVLFRLLGDSSGLIDYPPVLGDSNMVVFFIGITLLVGVLFGGFPFLQSSLSQAKGAIGGGGRTASGSLGQQRLRKVLVTAEIALALVILTGAGLLGRSYVNYLKADNGYNPEGVLTMQLGLPEGEYDSDEKKRGFYRSLLARAESIPGIEHIALSSRLLGGNQRTYTTDNMPQGSEKQAPFTQTTVGTEAYIQAMGMRLIEGRLLDGTDVAGGRKVALVDERFVEKNWPGESAVGKRFKFRDWYDIVGVVSHMKHDGVDQESRESVYLSAYQSPFLEVTITARGAGDPMRFSAPIRSAIGEIDPNLATSRIRTLQSIVDSQSYGRRFMTSVLGVFGLSALLLAVLGIYGVTSYAVGQRVQEFGIRMALGGQRESVVGLVLKGAVKITAFGVGIGLVVSLALGRLTQDLVFGVSPFDPATFVVTVLILVGCVMLAAYMPARRAARSSPMNALRAE